MFNGENSGFSKYDMSANIDAALIMDFFKNSSTTSSISNAIKNYYKQVIPELELAKNKMSEYTKIILGEFEDGLALKNAVKNKVENNIFIKGISGIVAGLNETYGISFEDNAEQFTLVYELFAKYLMGIQD